MEENKRISARVTNKHDTESNWYKAGTALNPFIPKAGELIIYDPDYDSIYSGYVRYKIGDGVTKVHELPFAISTVGITGEYGDLLNAPYVPDFISSNGVITKPLQIELPWATDGPVFKINTGGFNNFEVVTGLSAGVDITVVRIGHYTTISDNEGYLFDGAKYGKSAGFQNGELSYAYYDYWDNRDLYGEGSSAFSLPGFNLTSSWYRDKDYDDPSQYNHKLEACGVTIINYDNKATLSVDKAFEAGNDGKPYIKIGSTVLYEEQLKKLLELLGTPDSPVGPDDANYAMHNGEYLKYNDEYVVIK